MEGFILLACVVILCICLLSTVTYLLTYLGLFGTIQVSVGKPVVNNLWIAYKHHEGPYEKAGAHFTEVVTTIHDATTIAIFYDDPKKVEKEKLRYIVGAILAEGTSPHSEVVSLAKKNNFRIIDLPQIDFAVKAKFPFYFDTCALIGTRRVYPAFEHYIQEQKLSAYPFVEIYKENYIHYMAPLSKQNDFFVPETKPALKRSTEEGDETDHVDTTDDDTKSSTSSFEEINPQENI